MLTLENCRKFSKPAEKYKFQGLIDMNWHYFLSMSNSQLISWSRFYLSPCNFGNCPYKNDTQMFENLNLLKEFSYRFRVSGKVVGIDRDNSEKNILLIGPSFFTQKIDIRKFFFLVFTVCIRGQIKQKEKS